MTDRTILTVVGTSTTIKAISTKLRSKLLKPFDFYIEADELTLEEAKQIQKEKPDLVTREIVSGESWFFIKVKEPRDYFLVQHQLNLSIPMTFNEVNRAFNIHLKNGWQQDEISILKKVS
jgi:hypothetical protein